MEHNNKEIIIWKTILKSIWSYAIVLFLFISAILYAANFLEDTQNIGQICFYALMMLILMKEVPGLLQGLTFYSYKKVVKSTNSESEGKE
jgi:hypothetical protein